MKICVVIVINDCVLKKIKGLWNKQKTFYCYFGLNCAFFKGFKCQCLLCDFWEFGRRGLVFSVSLKSFYYLFLLRFYIKVLFLLFNGGILYIFIRI